jgi:UDP-glucuronate 4-epimerase
MLQFDYITDVPRSTHFIVKNKEDHVQHYQDEEGAAEYIDNFESTGRLSTPEKPEEARQDSNTDEPKKKARLQSTESVESQVEVKLPKESHSEAKILVTGAASFVGYHTITELGGERRKRIVAVDDFDTSLDDDMAMKRYRAIRLQQKYGVKIEETNICNSDTLEGVLKRGITHIFHFHDPIDPPISSETVLKKDLEHRRKCHETLLGVIKKLTKGQSHSIPVVYFSSSTVYADTHQTGSNTKLVNDTMVAINKLAQEEVARVHYKYDGLPSLGLRLFSVYGPMCSSSSPLNRIGSALMYGKADSSVHLSSTDFIFVKDLARSVISLLAVFDSKELPKLFPDLTVDMGSGKTIESPDIQKLVKSSLTNTATEKVNEISVFDKQTVADTTKLQKALGSDLPFMDLSEGIQDFAVWFKNLFFPKGFVLTTYLVSEKDPQRRTAYSTDGKYDLIKAFYESAHSTDVQSFVFHDGLSTQFINKYETPRFKFLDVHTLYSGNEESEVTKYVSNNDRRFFYFDRFMAQLKRQRTANTLPTYIMSSDLFDVRFRKNPFDYFDTQDPKSFYVGSETNKFKGNNWMNDRFHFCKFSTEQRKMFIEPENKYLLNAGLIAGRWEVMQEFLDIIEKEFPKFNPKSNCNMPLVSYIAYRDFPERIVTGQPFHDVYKTYNRDRKDVYILHK